MDLDRFIALRPFAWHTTAAANLAVVRRCGRIESTARLLTSAGADWHVHLPQRREHILVVPSPLGPVVIRDQRPLVAGAIAFDPGCDLAALVRHLNGLTFFWPGDARGPIPMGRNHLARYVGQGEARAVLRVPMRALLADNASRGPEFSRCNSGAPRMNAGRRQPRGATTFVDAELFAGTPGDVREVVFRDHAVLPREVAVAERLTGPWTAL